MEGDFNDRTRAECYVAVGGGNGEPTAQIIASNGLIESVTRNSQGNYTVTLRKPGVPQLAQGRGILLVSAINATGQWVTATVNPSNILQIFVFGWGVSGDPGAVTAEDTSFALSLRVAQRLGGITVTPPPDHPN
jgi:hypothetical protein